MTDKLPPQITDAEREQAERLDRMVESRITSEMTRIRHKRDLIEAEALVSAALSILQLCSTRHPLPQLKLDYDTTQEMLTEGLKRLRGAAELVETGIELTRTLPDDLQLQVDRGTLHLHEAWKLFHQR